MSHSIDPARIREDILRLLRNNGHKSYRPKEIAHQLNYKDTPTYQAFREVLHEMAGNREIARIKGGRFTFKKRERQREGVIDVNPRGFGFVAVEGEEEDFYVSPENLNTALHGDRVQIKLYAPAKGDDRREAEVERIIERARTKTVGTFRRTGESALVEPDDQRLTQPVFVPVHEINGATDGDKVVVSLDQFDAPEGRVLEVLGRASDPQVANVALAMSLDVRVGFADEVLQAAEAAARPVSKSDTKARLDLRDKPVFTIDPADAKDFDDAIHILPLSNGNLEVGIHIADVSHYVRPDTVIDKEAYKRATSTYLVGRVIPMLPEALSNGACSLSPDTDKLAYSCLLELTTGGETVRYEIRETVIHSHARLTYEQAQDLIDGNADHPMREDVQRAAVLSETLTKNRLQAGGIDFDTPEIRIILDENHHPVDIVRKERKRSNRLIEEFMLLANRTVAAHISKRNPAPPFVYRVHGKPDEERIQALAAYVSAFGYTLPLRNGIVRPEDLRDLLHHVRGTRHQAIVEQAAIRAMAKAVYAPENIGHFGLGFEDYTHFTSPIRRYPDLLVHRFLKAYAAGQKPPLSMPLDRACTHCSERERGAETAERESVKLKQVEFMQDHVGEQYQGVVSGVTKFGVFVELGELLVEGLAHVRDMDGYWEYDERQFALIEQGSNRKIRLGDTVEVIVAAANLESRQIDFVFVP